MPGAAPLGIVEEIESWRLGNPRSRCKLRVAEVDATFVIQIALD